MNREFRKDNDWFSCINLIEWICVGESVVMFDRNLKFKCKDQSILFLIFALEVYGIRHAVNKQLQASRQKEKEEPDIG